MPEGKYDFIMKQGDSWVLTIAVVIDGVALGTFPNNGTFTAAMVIKEYRDDSSSDAIAVLTTENGRINQLGSNLIVSLTASTTAAFVFNNAYYDLEITYPNGTKKKWLWGIVTLQKEITVDEDEMADQSIMSWRMGFGRLVDGADYVSIPIPSNIIITRVNVHSTHNASADATIHINTGLAGSGNLIIVTVDSGDNTGEWNSADSGESEQTLNKAAGHRLVIRSGDAGGLNNVDVTLSVKI